MMASRGRKVRINSKDNLKCATKMRFIHYSECISCEHAFEVNRFGRYVLCKRGLGTTFRRGRTK